MLQRRVAVAGCPSPSRSTTSPRRHRAPRAAAGAGCGRTDGLARLPGPTSSSSCCTSAHGLAGYTAITHPSCRHSPRTTAAATQPHRRGTGVPRAELSTPLRGGASACTAPWAPLLRPSQIPQIMENYDAGRAFRPCPQSSASHLAKHLPPRRCAGCSCARWRCTVHSGASAS